VDFTVLSRNLSFKINTCAEINSEILCRAYSPFFSLIPLNVHVGNALDAKAINTTGRARHKSKVYVKCAFCSRFRPLFHAFRHTTAPL
jgi:hypothetical protein